MAIPVAMGIEGMISKLDKATIAPGSPRRQAYPNTSIQTSDRAAAEANHLICWRSSPRPAEADKQRDHGPQPGHKHHRKRDELDHHKQSVGRAFLRRAFGPH